MWCTKFIISILFTISMAHPEALRKKEPEDLTRQDRQVNQEINEPDDLLAVENIISEVIHPPPPPVPPVKIVSAPRDFPGERLTGATLGVGPPTSGEGYVFRYENLEDGVLREQAIVELPNGGVSHIGAWEFIGSDGQLYRTQFVADENGYQPIGEHLPTPPPLPPALQRWEDAKNGLLSGKNHQKTVENNDIMIGVASADVLPNLRNGKQLSDTTDLDVEVFSPKIVRFGRRASISSTLSTSNFTNINKHQKQRHRGRRRHRFRPKPKV